MSRNDLEDLKRNWLQDPSWDLAATEGFEEYAEELRSFQAQQEARLAGAALLDEVATLAQRFGCSESLARYLLTLERRTALLEEQLNELLGPE